jgi:anti-sigma-K factor RskA
VSVNEPYLDCAECVDAAPYVLGALDDARSYREHLDGCATCRALVAELQRVVDMLPVTAPPAVASRALRRRVLAIVRSEADLLDAAGERAEPARRPATRFGSRRWSLVTASATIAALVTAVVAIAIGSGTSTSERVTRAQVAASAGGAEASLRQRDGRADLVVSDLAQPPRGKIYEVWLKRGAGSPQPTDALFGVTSQGRGAVDVPGSLHGVSEVLVTSEPLGGSSQPTGQPIIRVILGV